MIFIFISSQPRLPNFVLCTFHTHVILNCAVHNISNYENFKLNFQGGPKIWIGTAWGYAVKKNQTYSVHTGWIFETRAFSKRWLRLLFQLRLAWRRQLF